MLTAYQLSLSAGEEEPAACKTHRRTRNIAEDVGIQPWLSSPFGVPTVEEVPAISLGPVERAPQFRWMRQLPPAAFSVRHIPAAFSIDAKGPTMAR
jgi:hypothetical protein